MWCGLDDVVFTYHPSLLRDFTIPIDCVGDPLMVWGFASSIGMLMHLFLFSLQDFENAICHKDNNLIVIVETHFALLRLLIKDDGQYFTTIQENKWKPKVKHPPNIQNFLFLIKAIILTWYGLEESVTNILMVFMEKGGLSSICQYTSWVCDNAHTYCQHQ